jgi:TDG/mug DNA glycosylase family protein
LKEAFPPITSPGARILILGTMPSELSLERQEYYGNPLNKFWRIMQTVFDIPAEGTYTARIAGLQHNRIALWDVLHSCERVGSLDSAIKNAIPNDFAGLFSSLLELQVIAFNGKKASEWFERWARIDSARFQKLVLPCSSPAAAMAFEKKVAAWSILKEMGESDETCTK